MNTRRQFLIQAPIGLLTIAAGCRLERETGSAQLPAGSTAPGTPPTFGTAAGSGPAVNAAPGTIVNADRDALVVACGGGTSVRLLDLQFPGGKILSCAEVMNGRSELFKTGAQFDVA